MQEFERGTAERAQIADKNSRTLRFFAPDGVELVADELGPDTAPVVILMHGGGQTRHSWSGAMHALAAEGYRVINFDARGHGDSDWSHTGAYQLDDRVADLRTIVETLECPFALVGASLGGGTAIHAVARGISPRALVLVDIVPDPEKVGVERIVNFMRANPDGFSTLDEAVDAVAAYNPDRPRPSDPSGLMRNLRLRDNGRLYWHWDPQIAEMQSGPHHALVRKSAAMMARRNDIPVLLVRGLKSDVVSDAGVAAFRKLLPGLEVADVNDAGHMVAGDRNDAFNASVIAFLTDHLPHEAAK
tara:strand:- start:424 stop:1329 length:906 start_codon:yes stop_codon:yes gene_type:complete